jgi:hypothetical protein
MNERRTPIWEKLSTANKGYDKKRHNKTRLEEMGK